mmetsp:Transcript_16059/g.21783  ORF Transcript_16059/g.21783 Transcript_16059/m.21783 type:complete len:128 (-) Transcript_16059:1703-2086(-)|eukprot:CAMPEP_0185597910 /NCGR_PEP_ID=MMETSP0434-20130131/81662_1 /TAXON_ID=626734 ORGANISM="Favella taraikaensis, Strain Fe Narragansett Bay" /NCGR_SAMPLE_ID=MMETSP0434 /ASSEMBLY_ACC=CAM_ASM_000379 /LENGTH=127 /DNA_ID=CAMNT_0028226753 /DNA_START=1440 /DNA_END=1823 /DNA_ORIENTATION=-
MKTNFNQFGAQLSTSLRNVSPIPQEEFSIGKYPISTKVKKSVQAEEHQVIIDDQSNDTKYFTKSKNASFNMNMQAFKDDENFFSWPDSLQMQKIEVLELSHTSLDYNRGSQPEPVSFVRSKDSLVPG